MKIGIVPLLIGVFLSASIPTQSSAKAEAQNARQLLAQADRLAYLYNWPKAEPLYAQAETLFNNSGDKKDALYARLGWIWSQATNGTAAKFKQEVEADARNPLAVANPKLMIRCLVAQALIEQDRSEAFYRNIWEKILELAKTSGDKRWQARATAELGFIAFMEGDVERATSMLKTAMISMYLQGDIGAAIYYGSIIGNGMVETGNPQSGIKYCDTAIKMAAGIKDMGFPFMAFEGKARALVAMHHPDEAREVLNEAVHQGQAQHALAAESELLVVRGQEEIAVDRAQAIRDLQQARAFCHRNGFQHAEAWSTFELATAYKDQGDLPDAERDATAAERLTESLDDKYHLPEDLALMADVAAKQGRVQEADRLYSRAEDVTQGLLISAPSRDVESSLIATLSNIYVGHFRLAATKLKNVSGAFKILETARGRTIADQLRSGDQIQPPRTKLQQDSKREVERLQLELLHATSPPKRETLLENLFEAEQLLGPQGEPRTGFQEATLRSTVTPLKEIEHSLNPDEAILEYVLDRPHSFCLYITRHHAGIVALRASRAEVDKLVAQFRQQILTMTDSIPASRALYSILLAPLPSRVLKPILIIVPDGSLNLIPFDALTDDAGKYTLDSHVVSYAPSATVLHLIETARPAQARQVTFLGIGGIEYQPPAIKLTGNSKTDSEDIRRGILDPFDPKASPLPDLPESRNEVTAAGKIFGSSSVLLLGPAATDAAFEAESLGRFKIIHIAAHGIASAKYPDRAALVLAPDPADHDDGLLQVRQIRELHLNADLVTLSACDTGAGRLEGEEGIENIEQAFLFAGARSVLASLWLASDTFTTDLMKQFYRNLAAGEDENEALRLAKLYLVKSFGGKATPLDWAGFTLVGYASIRTEPLN